MILPNMRKNNPAMFQTINQWCNSQGQTGRWMDSVAQCSTVPCLKPHDSQIPRWKCCHSDEHLPATVQRFNMLRHIYIPGYRYIIINSIRIPLKKMLNRAFSIDLRRVVCKSGPICDTSQPIPIFKTAFRWVRRWNSPTRPSFLGLRIVSMNGR